jgi:hypothetical protein
MLPFNSKGFLMIKRLYSCCCRYLWGMALVMLWVMSVSARVMADGLTDFRNALTELKSTDPITVSAQFKLFGRSGESDQLVEREGLIDVQLADDAKGLRVVYSPALIAQLHAEELAKVDDENVKNSALNAVGEFHYWEWRELLYPAAQMELMLARYNFISEKEVEFEGRKVRLLRFSMPKEKVDKEFRKYVKKYRNYLQVWIDEKGVPIASQMSEKGSGRVFIIIGFSFENEVRTDYRQLGSRLVAIRREVKDESSGATMRSQRHFIETLAVESLVSNLSSRLPASE